MNDCHGMNSGVLALNLAIFTDIQVLASEAHVPCTLQRTTLACVASDTRVNG